MSATSEFDVPTWNLLHPIDREKKRYETWLKRSENWQGISGKWEGVRVLGRGGYGLCGLFKYKGSDENIPKYIVVKQSGSPDKALKNESRLLGQCRTSGSVHIVKMYKSYHQEGGTGTSSLFDPYPYGNLPILGPIYSKAKEVSRIYLEYCSRGDLDRWIRQLHARSEKISELNAWRVLECLARAAMVLERGHEGDPTPGSNHRPIAHFDIKPNNILIATRDADHPDLGVFKLADLGLSRLVPDYQSKAWFEYAEWRFTQGYGAPEQLYSYHETRRIDQSCNIWGIAASVYGLIMGGAYVPQEIFFIGYDNQRPFRTMGYELLNDENCNFSTFFKLTIFACLAYDPADRPNPRRIVERCQRAIAVLSTNPSADLLSTYRVYDESLRKLKRDPAPRGRFARPIYIGESALGPGSDIDEINLGSGLDDMAKLISRPKLAPLPPSPPPGYVPEDFSGHFHLPDQSTEESTYLSARQSKEARLVASGQVESGSKRQRGGAYNALLSTARGQIGFNLVGGYPISGMKGAKTAPGDTGEPMDLGMSSDE